MEFEKVLVVQDKSFFKICIMSSLKLNYIFSQKKGTFKLKKYYMYTSLKSLLTLKQKV